MEEDVRKPDKKFDTGTTELSTIPVSKPKLKEQGSVSSSGKKVPRKTKPLLFWTSADVNKWLKKHGGQCHDLYGELFLQQEVTGRTLFRLNEIKLERIGITNLQHRQELMQYILKLRLKHEGTDLKSLDQKGSGFELPVPDTKKQTALKDIKDKL